MINRRVFGVIVFVDKIKLVLLNKIVWLEIIKFVKDEIVQYGEVGFKVCVLDVVIFLEVGWDDVVDEVWVIFVFESEVLLRILLRDNIFKE